MILSLVVEKLRGHAAHRPQTPYAVHGPADDEFNFLGRIESSQAETHTAADGLLGEAQLRKT